MKKKFHTDYLKNELGLPDTSIVDKITGTSRWSIHHEIVFEDNGKFYSAHYSEGATECQDESPWDYQDEIECYEVELKEITKLEWVKK
jgi:hypothetical protein